MASKVHERKRARADLDAIWNYIAANINKAADAMLERIALYTKCLSKILMPGAEDLT